MDTVLEEHVSPDGLLRLIVIQQDDGDVSIGFDGTSWHTHADLLAAESGLSEDNAVRAFVDAIRSDTEVICIERVNGEISCISVTDDPLSRYVHVQPNETLEFRYWSGLPYDVDKDAS